MRPNTLIEQKPWALTLLLAGLTGLTALSIDMSLPAMPQLQETFGAGVASVQLTLSVFLAGFAAGQKASGPLPNAWGRRPACRPAPSLFRLEEHTSEIKFPHNIECGFFF